MSDRDWVPVRNVMRTDVTQVHGSINVFEALRIMKQVQATCLIIEKRFESDEYGLVLFSDIAKQVIARDRSPERVNVYEIMAKPVISVRPDMDIRYCARLFERFGISQAPVIQDQKVIGIVSYYLLVLEGLPDLD
jgi:predicted transcriptional regulator